MSTRPQILAVKLRALGDTVIGTAALSALHEIFPDHVITAVVPRAWASLLEGHPAIARVIPYRPLFPGALGAGLEGVRQRLSGPWDAALVFHASPSPARLGVMTGARLRGNHFHGHRDKNTGSNFEIPGKGQLFNAVDRDLKLIEGLARAMGKDFPRQKKWAPQIFLTDVEKSSGRAWLDEHGLKAPILALGLGASRPTKCWPIERYAELAHRWIHETGGGVLAVASALDGLTIGQLPASVVWAEDLPLRQLAAVLSQAALGVGNDSGPRHLAAAVGTRTLTLFGPADPFEWHPYPVDCHPYLFVEGLPCRKDADLGMPPWCGLKVCTTEGHRCMMQISVTNVLTQALKTCRSTNQSLSPP